MIMQKAFSSPILETLNKVNFHLFLCCSNSIFVFVFVYLLSFFEQLLLTIFTIVDRAHRVNEKNGVICLVVIFSRRVAVIKMSKIAHFCIF